MHSDPVSVPPAEPVADTIPGDSQKQRAAESEMLAVLGESLGVTLLPRRIEHPSGARVHIDGADGDLTVLVECWAHQGTAKPAQSSKLVVDAVKLHWIAQTLATPSTRLILCASDETAIRHLRGTSWQAQAIASLGVELHVLALPPHVVAALTAA